jgi:hypothetical protein
MWRTMFYIGMLWLIGAWTVRSMRTQDVLRTIVQRYRLSVQGGPFSPHTQKKPLGTLLGGVCGALFSIGVSMFVPFDGRVVVFIVASTLCGAMTYGVVQRARWTARRTRLIEELGTLSHRMVLCATDQCDVRDIVLRASRPLKTLRPYVQQFAVLWATDQRSAIETFRRDVGIPEFIPIAHALHALSRARSEDIGSLLLEHSKSLDATREADVQRRIENAPLWVSLAVMIPFMCCLLLFLYPWFVSVMEQLEQGFGV